MPKVIDNNVIIGDVLHEWSVPEYEQHSRNNAWYILMGVIGVLLVGFALITGNFLFALVIVLFSIIIFLQSHQDPIVIPFKITELGVVINNRFYPYSELIDFYIIHNPPQVSSLFVETAGTTRPKLRIALMDMNPNEVRSTLREFLDEDLEKEEEPFSDMLARRWMIH